MTSPRISVVVPVYNGEKYLEEAVQGVLHQTFQDWELLLVDDGSADGSVTLAQSHAASRPDKIRYLEHPSHANHGQFATRVFGARHARADVVALLDQDDVWNPNYLEAHWAIWESVQAQGVYLSYGPSLYWHPGDATGAADFVQSMPPTVPKVFAPGELLESYLAAGYANTPNPCCALVRREVFGQVGHFSARAKGSPFEDQYLWWFIASRWPVSIHTNVWVRYRKHDDNCYDRFTASPQEAIRTELAFLRTMRADLALVRPDHPLLLNGTLTERIDRLRAQTSSGIAAIPVFLLRTLKRAVTTQVKRVGKKLLGRR
jgi:glycosyltransferase involved in cell wall biosynthesis